MYNCTYGRIFVGLKIGILNLISQKKIPIKWWLNDSTCMYPKYPI